jgi:hypothetical protein
MNTDLMAYAYATSREGGLPPNHELNPSEPGHRRDLATAGFESLEKISLTAWLVSLNALHLPFLSPSHAR